MFKKVAILALLTLSLLAACVHKQEEKPAAETENVPYSRGPSGSPSIGEPTSPVPQ